MPSTIHPKNDAAFTVFTKAWTKPLPDLAKEIRRLGFDGVELPIRNGYQVTPQNILKDLPLAHKILADQGLRISSIAGDIDEKAIEACAKSDIPLIRICVAVDDQNYLDVEKKTRAQFTKLLPCLKNHPVRIGLQNHCDLFIASAVGVMRIIDQFDPADICAVWDPMHCALHGERPEMAIDILWSHLGLVNLKNAIWRQTNGPEAPFAQWIFHGTTGQRGLASWPTIASLLKDRNYQGDLCLSAEYTYWEKQNCLLFEGDDLTRLVQEDLALAKSLFLA